MSGTEPRRACPSSDVVGRLPPLEAHDLDSIDETSNLEIGSAWKPIDLGHKTVFGKQLVDAS